MTDSVMRFVSASNKSLKIDIFLARRSLYIMRSVTFIFGQLINKFSGFQTVHKKLYSQS